MGEPIFQYALDRIQNDPPRGMIQRQWKEGMRWLRTVRRYGVCEAVRRMEWVKPSERRPDAG